MEAAPLGDSWPEEARLAFVRLLGAGPAAIPVIETLDQRGLMTRTLPEWEAVRNRPQRNAYHRFTVDRHLCEAAAEAARLTSRVRRPDLLLVGAFLHDIGKGYPGDHSEAGVSLVENICARMGFAPDDVSILKTLVRHHLLLADTATRRDLADEATISAVAAAVGNQTTLELLAALTEADSLATGPAAWGSWKAGLIAELVERTAPVLAGQRARDRPRAAARRHRRAHRPGPSWPRALVLDGEGPLVTLVAPDRPGLFWRVAGTLALHGLDVVSARAWSSADGFAIERFRVQSVFGRQPDWPAVESDVNRVLAGKLSLEARLADRARDYAGTPRPAVGRPAPDRGVGRQRGVRLGHGHRGPGARPDRHAVPHHQGPGRDGARRPAGQGDEPGPRGRRRLLRRRPDGVKLTDEDHLHEIQRGIAVHLKA